MNAMPHSFHKQFYLLAVYAAVLLLLIGCNPAGQKTDSISDSGFYFDTVIQITLYDASRQYALDHCMELAAQYEQYFSDTLPDSDVSRINAHPNEPVTVHAETAELITSGLDYGKKSDGRFDITVGKLSDLWDFHDTDSPAVPDEAAILAAVSQIDYQNVTVEGNVVTLNATGNAAAIDLGGIAKGYIADKMKEYLLSEGITAGLINLGGNVLTLGAKPNGDSYTIGIQKPFSEDGTPSVSVDVTDRSVVTSGTYQRYFKQDGQLYHHILDVMTGYPCSNGLSSVTIISGSSTDGDALSTTVFLMGLAEGMDYVEALDDTEAIFITTDGTRYYSSGMGDVVPYKEY